jgi:hypothetical protein
MTLSSSAVDQVCGDKVETTAKKVEGQRDQQHGGREEERGTPIQGLDYSQDSSPQG